MQRQLDAVGSRPIRQAEIAQRNHSLDEQGRLNTRISSYTFLRDSLEGLPRAISR